MKCEWLTNLCMGSDVLFYVDGRLNEENIINEARKVKKSFEDNFPIKASYMIKFECKKGVFYV